MGNIVLLDELTINKIAAGEVIERPASVIKEMVENSIDAGATKINIEIKNGGISYICITDNGKGIGSDDMEMAFERHATSKIRNADDLEDVKSMGFRGEALASIAAISNVEMVSKTSESETGFRMVLQGGNILEKEETACQIGTSITVKELFFNTPVRYKFLKKDYTEAGYIEDIITRLSLVNPNIAFKLINSGKTIIQTSGNGDLKGIIYNIYGKNIADGVLNVEYKYEDIHITGVVGKPEIARSNRSNQLFFVNNRYIKDKTLSSATEKSFKGMLPIGKYGFLILNLNIDPKKVDVNVHPAKLEVRFEEESKIFKSVYHAINDTLLKNDLIKNTNNETDNNSNTSYTNQFNMNTYSSNLSQNTSLFREVQNDDTKVNDNEKIEEVQNANEKLQEKESEKTENESGNIIEQLFKDRKQEKIEIENNTIEIENNTNVETSEMISKSQEDIDNGLNTLIELQKRVQEELEKNKREIENKEEQKQENIEDNKEEAISSQEAKISDLKNMMGKLEEAKLNPNIANFDEMYVEIFGNLPPKDDAETENVHNASELIQNENISVFEEKEEYKYKPEYKFIGIAFSTYIMLEMDKELYIMDQHAAHERIMYEQVKKNYYSNSKKDSQLMLLPDIITLTHKEMDILKENWQMFEKSGFTLEEFGENTIKLTGTPSVCLELDTKELFLETLDEINTVARTAKQEIEEKFIATIACKAAVKANMVLAKEEVESLMDKLLLLPNPFTCPHGRPTVIKMSKIDIEKKFSRR